MDAPCKNCPDRCPEPNCHFTCEKYIAFSDRCKHINDIRKEQSINSLCTGTLKKPFMMQTRRFGWEKRKH